MENEKVVADNSNTAEEVALESTQDTETSEDLKTRLAKAEELANNYKVRAEKAERKAKEGSTIVVPPKPQTGLSQLDTVAIIRNNVHEDDVPTVADYAKLKGISIAEALKTTVIKTVLSENNEKRTSASASNTGSARRGAMKLTDEELIERAERGQMPDDVEALAKARMAARKRK
jgi:hypothetical protein